MTPCLPHRWRLALLMLLAALAPSALRAQTITPPADAEVWTADKLAAAGVVRLSDLFTLLDGWYGTTTEGFSWDASVAGLAPPGETDWLIVLDGQPLDPRVLGSQHINVLPIHVAQLAEVASVARPVLVAGRLAPAGVLYLTTRRPPEGYHARGRAAAGNEIGDPGPFRYTPGAAANVDRVGPELFAEASYGRTGGWYLQSYRMSEHHATDPALLPRVREVYLELKNQRHLYDGLFASSGAVGRRYEHRATYAFSHLKDLNLFEPLGREIPLVHQYGHLGVSGRMALAPWLRLAYQASAGLNDLDERLNTLGLVFDWRQDRAGGTVEATVGGARLSATLGGSVDAYRVHATAPGARRTDLTLGRAHLALAARPVRAWTQRLTATVTHVDGRYAPKALAETSVRTGRHSVDLSLAYLHTFAEETNSVWYWLAQGYDLETRDRAPVTVVGLSSSRTLTADLRWRLDLGGGWQARASAFARRFAGLTLPNYRFAPDPASQGLLATTAVVPHLSGSVYGGRAGFRGVAGPLLHTASYTYQRPVAGDALVFWKAWSPVPRHVARYQVRYTPVPRLTLFGQVRFQSAASWPAFRPADVQTGGRYSTRQPPYVVADLTVQKHLWGDHLTASLSLRNATNTPMRLHPAGATDALTAFVQLEARF